MTAPLRPIAPSGSEGPGRRSLDRRFFFRLYVGVMVLFLFSAALESSLVLRVGFVVVASMQALLAAKFWRDWHSLGRWLDPPDAAQRMQLRERRYVAMVAVPIVFAIALAATLVL